MLLGHVHVAQRLGIPLQWASLEPLSPTFQIPHMLRSLTGCEAAVTLMPHYGNFLSHGVVDGALSHVSVADVLTQSRSFIGLTSSSDRPDPLVQWEVLHMYLYSPVLLPTVFAFSLANVPVVYFVVSTCKLPFDAFEDLVRNIDLGDQQLRVLVIIQVQEQGSTTRSPYRSEFVYLVDTDPPYAQLFPCAAATIHWGELDVLAEGLHGGKPVAVCGSHPSQIFTASPRQRLSAGTPPIDLL
ncbi:hypothetical protein PI125_g18130 [Phytophthora idaei]|nr:hypothetical protein PI125_g18130 [Phytophthora idaei]